MESIPKTSKTTTTKAPSGHIDHSIPFKYSRSLAKGASRMRSVRGIICGYNWIADPEIHRSERAVQVRALAGEIVLCSWATHFTLALPLSAQVHEWVPANCWGNLTNRGEGTCDGLASRPGGVECLLAASCYSNRDKLW